MTSYLWILLFGVLVITKAQELDLGDALGGDDEPTPKPAEPPKTGGGELDLGDAFGGDDEPTPKPAEPPKTGGGGLDLEDALLPDLEDPVTEAPKQPVIPPNDGGAFSDSDLNIDGHKPDPGQGGRSRANSGDTTDFQDDQPKAAEGGQMAGIISAVAVAIFGAASSYFAYQKKKLCFKGQGGTDPESGRNQAGNQSDPQAYSDLLRSS
ncbi:CD99 molecule isoform X2 [Neoarius graeffei]|uniref:CD99 molecule isoform X2 n=1 Tax=Neoarius graeffei TaxID=443677 RepID=UPI00298CB2B8|nr:CD99 molecule isoform X2 [Neoarius graeffei]